MGGGLREQSSSLRYAVPESRVTPGHARHAGGRCQDQDTPETSVPSRLSLPQHRGKALEGGRTASSLREAKKSEPPAKPEACNMGAGSKPASFASSFPRAVLVAFLGHRLSRELRPAPATVSSPPGARAARLQETPTRLCDPLRLDRRGFPELSNFWSPPAELQGFLLN